MVTALRDARFEQRLLELGPASDRVWLVAMGTGLVFTLITAYPFAHTPSGSFWAYAGLLWRASSKS